MYDFANGIFRSKDFIYTLKRYNAWHENPVSHTDANGLFDLEDLIRVLEQITKSPFADLVTGQALVKEFQDLIKAFNKCIENWKAALSSKQQFCDCLRSLGELALILAGIKPKLSVLINTIYQYSFTFKDILVKFAKVYARADAETRKRMLVALLEIKEFIEYKISLIYIRFKASAIYTETRFGINVCSHFDCTSIGEAIKLAVAFDLSLDDVLDKTNKFLELYEKKVSAFADIFLNKPKRQDGARYGAISRPTPPSDLQGSGESLDEILLELISPPLKAWYDYVTR